MASQISDLTTQWFAQVTFRVRNNCALNLEKAETDEGRKVWSRQLDLIDKQISDYGVEQYARQT